MTDPRRMDRPSSLNKDYEFLGHGFALSGARRAAGSPNRRTNDRAQGKKGVGREPAAEKTGGRVKRNRKPVEANMALLWPVSPNKSAHPRTRTGLKDPWTARQTA
jgi:hypothetical protein